MRTKPLSLRDWFYLLTVSIIGFIAFVFFILLLATMTIAAILGIMIAFYYLVIGAIEDPMLFLLSVFVTSFIILIEIIAFKLMERQPVFAVMLRQEHEINKIRTQIKGVKQ